MTNVLCLYMGKQRTRHTNLLIMKKTFTSVLFVFLFSFCWQLGISAQHLPATIQEGNILHCFDWKYSDIQASLEQIATAGFTAVQTSPAQTNYTGQQRWYDLYRPRDAKIGPNSLGTKADLQALCTAAHAKGIKVIVDIIANHTDGSTSVLADFWKDMSLYHQNGGANDGSRFQVTHGNIGMLDLKTEDSRVQAKFKEYVQELKSVGVDGCRWDAAKHIGVPSEGDNFWPSVIDKSMFNYGEILNTVGGGADGTILPEYMKYMSVVDNVYSTNNVLNAAKSGRAPSVAGCYAMQFNNNKVVYWGESHDTYCNSGDASDGVSQEVVDRAYAVAAAHNQIPALYFSRPNGSGVGAKVPQKGSTHFTSKSVAEVNKFHNAMNGKPDYYTGNGSTASITRKNGGAIVVNFSGAGQVSIANGGSFATPGSYIDQVSGNQWTITTTTISGQTDGTGIAVLYNASTEPEMQISPKGGDIYKTTTVSVILNNATSGWYQIGDAAKVNISGNTTFTVGDELPIGSSVTVKYAAAGQEVQSATFNMIKQLEDTPKAGVNVYYNNPDKHDPVFCYVYSDEQNNGWATEKMAYDAQLVINHIKGWWYYTVPTALIGGNAMLSWNGGQYPGASQPGIALKGKSLIIDGTSASSYGEQVTPTPNPTPQPTPQPSDDVYVYYDNPNNWSAVYCYLYNSKTDNVAQWPGTAMTYDANISYSGHTGWYKLLIPKAYVKGRFIVNNNGGQQYPAAMRPGEQLHGESVFLKGTTVYTKISNIEAPSGNADNAWYTLSGVRLTKPSQSGIYLHNGKKFVIK